MNYKLSKIKRNILLFTNDLYTLFTYQSVLEDLGYYVIGEDNITLANHKLNTVKFQFIIVDLVNNKKNGFLFIKEIKKIYINSFPLYLIMPGLLTHKEQLSLNKYQPFKILTNERLLLSELFIEPCEPE